MSVDSVPSKQTHTNQSAVNWRQYANVVTKPAAVVFSYALAASFGLLGGFAFLLLWSRGGTLADAMYWFAIAAASALFLAGMGALSAYFVFRKEYISKSATNHQRTDTEYRTVKTQPEGTTRPSVNAPTSMPNAGHIKVGKYGFTDYQLKRLAKSIANGGTFSHAALMDAKIIGDRTTPGNAQKARDIQAELVRLGYAYSHGRNTVCSELGREWLAPYLPSDLREGFLTGTQPTTTNHNDD